MARETLGLSEEHRDLRDSVRAFAGRHITETEVRAAVDAKTEQLPPFWAQLAEQGLFGLHLPDSVGGAGFGLLELAVVLEELGRNMAPGPFLPTVLASAVLLEAGHHEHLPVLADGSATGAVGLGDGFTAERAEDGGLFVSGSATPVLGAHLADVLVLRVDADSWVVLPGAAAEVSEVPSHDLTRRLATVTLTGVHVPAADVLDIPADRPCDLAAILFAAEACGIADWCTATAAEYAGVREQFGRPIGQFQGVKHRCARMLARTEAARACAWDAARAHDAEDAAEEVALAAAVAGATCVEAGFSTAKDCIQVLGGIGFTWEHDAGLHLRRAQTSRLLLGSTAHWHQRIARLALGGARREVTVDLPPEAAEIRAVVRAELAEAVALPEEERIAFLAEHGYTAPHLPKPWGRGADAVEQLTIAEEMRAAQVRAHDMVIGNWVVPTLIRHGDEAQQRRFLPASLRGDITWCQLFSEPGAGSDLAGLSTRAEKVDGGWKINGQKVWTSVATEAHYGILLARTDPDAPKHKGLSYFLLDMDSPGITIRPLRELTGEALFNEVFLDDVFVPDDMLVAQPGDGWKLARTTLANERVALSQDSSLGAGGEALLELAAARADDHRLAVLGQILADAQAGALLGLRQTIRSLSGQQPGAESSIAKFLGVEHVQQVWETAMEWQGPAALHADHHRPDTGVPTATWKFLNTRCLSIAGGTTEVQLNIIGERLLGLPRDPEPHPKP
ncbi:Acyl-CoA dehydrogenase [Saccharopolyspora antimicrobica]|uniref:Acyl-CoA dehydrogenase n=1 Tax=Saccharopolyspora antimicrobica TaxID=455193 RepID=A0A1I5K023_9PSEU|nr:acyl-CoA dehydrogenase [Saccharopolyspora antimicrobica]RKT87008.1 alkylation response protein AidB-like acyl-CoA dehydrogenase [Saccharopolyspora antimicrobica]SFO77946.1 Acyl-CoA dehydrogenase [Saccharopolyspora antimicrobica]